MPDARFRRRPYIGAGEMQNANMYQGYLHLHPARGQTLSEITGVEPQGNAPLLVTEIYGKRMGDEGYLEVQKGGFLERVDAIEAHPQTRVVLSTFVRPATVSVAATGQPRTKPKNGPKSLVAGKPVMNRPSRLDWKCSSKIGNPSASSKRSITPERYGTFVMSAL